MAQLFVTSPGNAVSGSRDVGTVAAVAVEDDRPTSTGSIRIAGACGHEFTAAPNAIALTHVHDVLVGYATRCTICQTHTDVDASPAQLGLMLEVGVPIAPEPLSPERALPVVNDHRRRVSELALPQTPVPAAELARERG